MTTKIEYVNSKVLHDYAGMNSKAAKAMGFKMPDNTIYIDKEAKNKKRILKHERHEMRLMKKGMKYWPAHLSALEAEKRNPEEAVMENPMPIKGSTRKFSGKLFYYLGRTLYPNSARSIALRLSSNGIEPKVTESKGRGFLVWGSKFVTINMSAANPGETTISQSGNNPAESSPGQSQGGQNPWFGRKRAKKEKGKRTVRIVGPTAHAGQSELLGEELGVGNPKLDPWGVPIGYYEYSRHYSETEAKEQAKRLRKKGRTVIVLQEGYRFTMWAVFVKKRADENPITSNTNPLTYVSPRAKKASSNIILAKVYLGCNKCGKMTPVLEVPGEGFSGRKDFKCVHCGNKELHFERVYQADRQGRILDNPIGYLPGTVNSYKYWVEKKGHITPYASSVLQEYAKEFNLSKNDYSKLAKELGIQKNPVLKIKPEHYAQLKSRIFRLLKQYDNVSIPYALSSRRARWDIYWAAGAFSNASEYHYLDDNNIDSALKAILNEYQKTSGASNPKVSQDALDYLKMYKGDVKAGHNEAALYWKGAAAAAFTANPRICPKGHPVELLEYYTVKDKKGLIRRRSSRDYNLYYCKQCDKKYVGHELYRNPTLSIPIKNEKQLNHLFTAEDELNKAGLSFDHGTGFKKGKPVERDWEFDWSLKGAELHNPTFPKIQILHEAGVEYSFDHKAVEDGFKPHIYMWKNIPRRRFGQSIVYTRSVEDFHNLVNHWNGGGKVRPATWEYKELSNPLTKSEKQDLMRWGKQQYAISDKYFNDHARSEFYHGRAVAAGKIAAKYNPLPKGYKSLDDYLTVLKLNLKLIDPVKKKRLYDEYVEEIKLVEAEMKGKNPVIKPPAGYRYFDARPKEVDANKLADLLKSKGYAAIVEKGVRMWHVFIPAGSKNPILETLGTAIISGVGLSIGFKGIDKISKTAKGGK